MSDRETERALADWLQEVDTLTAEPWERLPELELYMDQVITLMNKQLSAVSVASDRPLTSSMINNYVKDGVMPRPHQKKYDREHLTVLLLICMLKSVFSLPEIKQLINGLEGEFTMEELYPLVKDAQIKTLQKTADAARGIEEMSEAERYLTAMRMALQANASRIVAAQILSSIADPAAEETKEKKKKKDKTDA